MKPYHHVKIAEAWANLLDNQFNILGFTFGIDQILDVLPIGGDILSIALSAYILWIGTQMGVSGFDMFRMIGNIVIEFLLGLIPFIGPIGDAVFKANIRNVQILKQYAHSDVVDGKIV